MNGFLKDWALVFFGFPIAIAILVGAGWLAFALWSLSPIAFGVATWAVVSALTVMMPGAPGIGGRPMTKRAKGAK